MRNSISKAIVAAVAALTVSAAVVFPTTPASAVMMMHGGGFHGGGFGGFRPGFGGLHPGFRPGFVGVRSGFRPRVVVLHRGRFFHPGLFGPTVVTGVAFGAGWGGYGAGCWVYRPFYDAAGNYLGQGYVNICS